MDPMTPPPTDHPYSDVDETLRQMMCAMGVPRYLIEPFAEDMKRSNYAAAKITDEHIEKRERL